MKIQTEETHRSALSEFSSYYVPDELDDVESEIDRQKILADYCSREN